MALVPSPDQDSDESKPVKKIENDEASDQGDGVGKMSFLDHLDELRHRLVVSFSSLMVGVLICFGFIDPIFDFIMEPLTDVLPEGGTLVYTEPAEAFFLNIKIYNCFHFVLIGALWPHRPSLSFLWWELRKW